MEEFNNGNYPGSPFQSLEEDYLGLGSHIQDNSTHYSQGVSENAPQGDQSMLPYQPVVDAGLHSSPQFTTTSRFTAGQSLAKGAIARPGSDTKSDGQKCLTCIEYNRSCNGNSLGDDGRCETCRGNGKGQQRKCFWLEHDVSTYGEAKVKYGARRIPHNTKEAREGRGVKRSKRKRSEESIPESQETPSSPKSAKREIRSTPIEMQDATQTNIDPRLLLSLPRQAHPGLNIINIAVHEAVTSRSDFESQIVSVFDSTAHGEGADYLPMLSQISHSNVHRAMLGEISQSVAVNNDERLQELGIEDLYGATLQKLIGLYQDPLAVDTSRGKAGGTLTDILKCLRALIRAGKGIRIAPEGIFESSQ